MFRSKLAARTVSGETALPCLDHVSEPQGFESAISEGGSPNEHAISLGQLIVLGRKRGIKLRPRSLNWTRLLIASAIAPVLLRLNNGNMIVILRNKEADPTQVVVSDPLYEDGEPFLLPQDTLEQAWAGEALTVEPRQSKAERAVTLLIWVLSVCGLIAGAFFLVETFREFIGN